jgi:hypothetical protein
MEKIYLARHQAHGVVHEFPFSQAPTESQMAKVWSFCFGIHGASHPKTPSEPYWITVVEREVLGPEDSPVFEAPGLKSVSSVAVVGELSVSGVGTVTPREAMTISAADVGVLNITPKAGA